MLTVSMKREINSSTSGTLGTTTYTAQYTYNIRKATKYADKRVHVELTVAFDINIPTGRALATVPTGFRPSVTKTVPAIIVTEDTTVITGIVSIATDGTIVQNHTGYARKIYVDAWYDI